MEEDRDKETRGMVWAGEGWRTAEVEGLFGGLYQKTVHTLNAVHVGIVAKLVA